MAPQTAKSLMKEFRASFRRKKDPTAKLEKAKEHEEDENAKVAEFRDYMGENLPVGYSDAAILSILRARSLNLKDAEKLIKLDVNLRKFLRISDLLDNYHVTDLSENHRVSNVIGFDKERNLVRVMNIGLCDIKGFIHCMSTVEHFKLFIWFLEKDIRLCEKGQHRIIYILDLANINLGHILYKPAMDTGLVALKLLQDHYHDIVKSVYIVNAPPLFHSTFKIFKAAIKESLHRKIKIYGSDGYKEELSKLIDDDVLPVYLGGKRKGSAADHSGREFVGIGGEIPISYYPNHFLNVEEEGMMATTVGAGSSVSFRYPILEEGTLVTYHFQAKENDIGVCLFLDGNNDVEAEQKKKKKDEDVSKLEQLVPVIRSQCHICPEVGSFITWFTGTLVLYFDNTYSWMSSKEVTFKMTFEPPSSSNRECIREEVMQRH